MIIVVNHSISNPTSFWASAQKSLPALPENGVQRVMQVMPDNNMCKTGAPKPIMS